MLYGEDLALIHDSGFADFAARAAGEVVRRLRDAGIPRGLVVELGCGSGVLGAALLGAGYGVMGLDISPEMIALARARAPDAAFRCASWEGAEIPPCAAVAAVGEVVNYTSGAGGGGERLAPLLARIGAALAPGGLLVFDFATPGRCPGAERMAHTVAADWAVLCRTREEGCELTRHIVTFRRQGELYRRSEETHRLALYEPAEVGRLLAQSGFEARAIGGYGDRTFPAGHAAFVAQKR